MATATQVKFQTPNAPTLESNFQDEWSQAQDDYSSAIRAGYSADDANRLYLEPVQQKWQIAASSPGILSDKKRFNQFNDDFNAAHDQFVKNYQSYSRDGGEWAATQPGSIAPTLQKWSVESKLPVPPQVDPLLAEKEGALQEAREGFNPQDILHGHPQAIFGDPVFMQRFNTAAGEGYKARQKEEKTAAKSAAVPDVLKIGNRRAAFERLLTQGSGTPGQVNTNLPPTLKALYDSQIGSLDQQLTNPPPASIQVPGIDLNNPPVRFQPSPGASSPNSTVVPKAAIDYLKANPQTKQLFEQKYGAGAADAVLQQLGQQ